MEALLVFLNVEGPVPIKIPTQVDSSELNDGLGHPLRPAHSRSFHPVFDQILTGALDRPAGDGPAVGEVFVITHASAIPV